MELFLVDLVILIFRDNLIEKSVHLNKFSF